MPNKDEKRQIKQYLESIFLKDDNISFYLLKKSKVKTELENKILFKTKKKTSAKKAKSIEKNLQKELGTNWEFIQWRKFIGKVIPEPKVYNFFLILKILK